MSELLQLILSGLATGAIYALVATGFVLVWQTSQTINFAQGEFVMLPAILILMATKVLGLSLWMAFALATLLFVVVFGIGFKRMIVDPMIRHGVLPLAIATMALSILMREGAKDAFSAEAHQFPSLVPQGIVSIGGAALSLQDLAILVVAVAVIGALHFFIGGTRTGRAMQATAQNPTVARILGIPVERMVLLTFVINAALAALASFLISPIYLAKFSNGEVIGIAAFIAAIVGGFNQIRGAIAGGLLVGLADNLAAGYLAAHDLSTAYRSAVPLVLLVLVILLRPQGLLGRGEERSV